RRRLGIRVRHTAISFIQPPAGSSPDCGWRNTRVERFHLELSDHMTTTAQTALRAAPSLEISERFASEVIAGLSVKPKRLPAKYFYDLAGSALFERITQLPEYYPTRCEVALLRENAPAIASPFPAHCALLEFGAGSSKKAQILLVPPSPIQPLVPLHTLSPS